MRRASRTLLAGLALATVLAMSAADITAPAVGFAGVRASGSPATTLAPEDRASTRIVGRDRFGLAAGGNMHNLSAADLARELDGYKAVGSQWVRMDVNWSLIQARGPTSYEWEPFDRVVQAARARGLKVLAGVLYTPAWARPGTSDSTYPPVDPRTYASFMRAAVSHYAPMGVHHWEIWNEPNISRFWKPGPDPAAYAALLELAYAAVKQADRTAFVVSAGLSPYGVYGDRTSRAMNPLTFLERMYAAGARGEFDGLGWHPYNFSGIFFHRASAWSQLSATTPSARSLMVANGDRAKQIWGTEFGAPSGGASGAVTELAQARLVAASYARWRTFSWAGPLFLYSYRNTGALLGDREQNFGLVRLDFSPKPSWAAYRANARRP